MSGRCKERYEPYSIVPAAIDIINTVEGSNIYNLQKVSALGASNLI
jgi:hypothetical protein